MALQQKQLAASIQAVLLCTGIAASSIATAAEPEKSSSKAQGHSEKSADKDDMVEVRISLPDGRVITRYEPASKNRARRSIRTSSRATPNRRTSQSRFNIKSSRSSANSSQSNSAPGNNAPRSRSTRSVSPEAAPEDAPALLNTAPPQAQQRATGTNLAAVVDYSTQWPFVDVFKARRAWISGDTSTYTWNDNRPIEIDEDGWVTSLLPNQKAHTLMCREISGHYPAGRYVCLYEGEGTIQLKFDARVVSQSPGRIEFDVLEPSDSGIGLAITEVDPENYIRNIRVIMPGFEDTYEQQPFHPTFLDSLRSFSTIRFMDWQHTNNAEPHSWADRPEIADAGYAASGFGVPIEVMIQLCNELDVNPWFCMAHGFDDEYVDQFAQLVDQLLEPELTAYVEHSNEVWNGIFEQSRYAKDQANELDIPGNSLFEQSMRYHSQRSVEIFDIWDDHFSQDRLVRVMGGWHAVPHSTSTILNWNKAYQSTDAFAVAPYFGGSLGSGDDPNQTLTMTSDQVIDACLESIESRQQTTSSHIEFLSEHGIELVAYESGQHLVGVGGQWVNNADLTDLLIATNRNPRMYNAYMKDIKGWHDLGGGLMMAFSYCSRPSRYGSWGMLEHQTQPLSEAHKMRAHLDYRAKVDGKTSSTLTAAQPTRSPK